MWFQLRQFASTPYFVQLMLISTLSITFIQFLAFRAWGGDPLHLWIRSGVIGMWTMSVTSAGIISFERHKGTLVHLVGGRISPLYPLLAVVSAASIFGIGAFVVAWGSWSLLSGSLAPLADDGSFGLIHTITGITLCWVSSVCMSLVIASIFVLTPNAIAYEQLLVQPLLIASGILFTQSSIPKWLEVIGFVTPLGSATRLLFVRQESIPFLLTAAQTLGTAALWCLLAAFLGHKALQRVRVTATLEVI